MANETATPLLDEIAELGQPGQHLLDVVERLAEQARLERLTAVPLPERVRLYLARNPGASTRAVQAAVGGRRAEVLAAIRGSRAGSNPGSQP